MNKIAAILVILFSVASASSSQEITLRNPIGYVEDLRQFDFEAAGAYEATGVVKYTSNVENYPVEPVSFIIDPRAQTMYYNLGQDAGEVWILPDITYATVPTPEGTFCAYVAKNYTDEVTAYKEGFMVSTFQVQGKRYDLFAGLIADIEGCGIRFDFSCMTDEWGHVALLGQAYPLNVSGTIVVIKTSMQFYNVNPGVGLESVPPLPSSCPGTVISYCELFYPDGPFLF